MKEATLTTVVNGKAYEIRRYKFKSIKSLFNRVNSITTHDMSVYTTIKVTPTFTLTY